MEKKLELKEETCRKIKNVASKAAKVALVGAGFITTFRLGVKAGSDYASNMIGYALKNHDEELHKKVVEVVDSYVKK